jgi:hypothetical protein
MKRKGCHSDPVLKLPVKGARAESPMGSQEALSCAYTRVRKNYNRLVQELEVRSINA